MDELSQPTSESVQSPAGDPIPPVGHGMTTGIPDIHDDGFAPGRGKETLFRVTFRNQVNHIAIADNKANMIININTILISLVIAVMGSGLTIGGTPFLTQKMLVIPMTILMIACLISAIFAVLAARPKVSKAGKAPTRSSLLFFGRISTMDLDRYLDEMKGMLGSREDIYENLIIDIFHQGRILQKKYSLIQFSYTFFIVGLSGSVVTFLLLWATQ